MKFIHLADVHLDSKLESNFIKSLARERRRELLVTFRRVVAYGKKEGVRGLIIAGDFFDSDVVSRETASLVHKEILENPDLDFFYLRGNHDKAGFFNKFDSIPKNLKPFSDEWKKYRYRLKNGKQIVIAGLELHPKQKDNLYDNLRLREEAFNIVILHGEVSEAKGEGDERIEIQRLFYKNIDYLALGHIHKHKRGKLPYRGEYCYSGCLEGRGFDELGEHGFVLIDIREDDLSYQADFIPFAKRRLFELEIDVTECLRTKELAEIIIHTANSKGITEADLVKVILIGTTSHEEGQDILGLTALLETEFYFVKVYDNVRFRPKLEDLKQEESVKGEFIRLVEEDETLSEEEKEEITRYGLQVLRGEELEL